MADLSVDFAGLKLKNPFIIASSELTNKLEKIKIAEEHGASAVSTKLTFLKVPLYARPYHIIEKEGAFYSPSGERMRVEDTQELIRQCKEQTELKIIANMMGPGEDLEGWAKLGRMLEEAGADMLELNMSCPNLGLMAKQLGVDEEPELGATLGKDPALAGQVCKAVADAVGIPVMPKMTPEANTMMVGPVGAEERRRGRLGHQLPAVSAAARHQERRQADVPVDRQPVVRRPVRSLDPAAGLPAHRADAHHLSGPAAGRRGRPHELAPLGGDAHVRRHRPHVLLPALPEGLQGVRQDRAGLRKFMDDNGYETLADMRGIALRHIVTPGEVHYIPMLPEIDLEKCNGCGLCAAPGHCECIEIVDKKAVLVKPKECYSCAVCYFLCARDAIRMKEVPIEETRAGVAVWQ